MKINTCLGCESVDLILQPVETVATPRVMPVATPDAGGRDGARDERVAGVKKGDGQRWHTHIVRIWGRGREEQEKKKKNRATSVTNGSLMLAMVEALDTGSTVPSVVIDDANNSRRTVQKDATRVHRIYM